MKVTPNSTMVAPQDDLDLNLVTSRIKRFLKTAIDTLAHYKKVDHKNRHAMKKGEANTKAACLIINLFNKNGTARIVADISKSGLYNATKNNKRTSQNGNCKAAKSNGKNTRSPAKKKTKPARQQKQENSNFHFVNNCPDCKFAQEQYKLTNNQCFDCGILDHQAKIAKKSTQKSQSPSKIAQKATTDYFKKLTSATKNQGESTESFNSNLNFSIDAIYEEKEGENKQENDFQYSKNLDESEYNFNKIKDAKEGAIYIAQTLHSDRTRFAIIFNFIEKAENAMTIMSREKPNSTSKTKAETSARIVEDVYRNWRKTTERIHFLSAKRTHSLKNNSVFERRMLKSLNCIDEQVFDDHDHRKYITSSKKTGQNAHKNRMKRSKNVSGKRKISKVPRNNAQKYEQKRSRREINEEKALLDFKNDETIQDLINCYQKVLQN